MDKQRSILIRHHQCSQRPAEHPLGYREEGMRLSWALRNPPPTTSVELTRQCLHLAHIGGALLGPHWSQNCDVPEELCVGSQTQELIFSLFAFKVLKWTEDPV